MEKKDRRLSIRLPAAVLDALTRAADADRRTVGNLAVKILADWLAREGWLATDDVVPRRRRP
ncbi:ribbon-helix-helix domain-containing protein [Anaeromyxobacter oryzae]|uniref:ribbon-helix-helix domain-containing protein n=1 Tax=Anaeromyxobacter oryzae TaxID=2918170 RepID=UPI0020BE713D|nr:hypothetical protein [Anaeromyxobacter oryzae]